MKGVFGNEGALRFLFHLSPDDIFVIPPIDQRVDLSAVIGAKKNSTFNAFAKENFGSFRQQRFTFPVSFHDQMIAVD